ncbi:Bro-N domain-containing protein [Microbulbifer sp. ANSA001]|uniref:BRO-N domain-containing protein n=1 Tax=Microbulbifer sp. ANSA001 TaxID=3243358 RepID=UPI00404192ED
MSNVIPFDFKNRKLRVIEEGGEFWFVAKDVAEVLNYSDAHKMTNKLDDDEKSNRQIGGLGSPTGGRGITVINESGLYSVILASQKSEAKAFKRWVTHEVLPSIRKTGQYGEPKEELSGDKLLIVANRSFGAAHGLAKRMGMKGNQAILLANRVVEETTGISPMKLMGVTHLEAENNEPLYTPSELGKAYEMSAREFNAILQRMGLQKHVEYKPRKKRWELTPKGEEFGRYCDTGKNHSGGAPVQQLKWRKAVLEEVARYAEQLRDKLPGGPFLKVV